MKYIAYARGRNDMELKEQVAAIQDFCMENEIKLFRDKVYSEHDRGKMTGMPVYTAVKEIMDTGKADVPDTEDGSVVETEEEFTLIIPSMYTIGMNKYSLLEELQWLEDHKTHVVCLDIPHTKLVYRNKYWIECTNRGMIEALQSVIKVEQKRKDVSEAQREVTGKGITSGRPRTLSKEKFNEAYERVLKGEIRPFDLIEELRIPKGTYYRYKADYDREHAF